MTKQPQTCYVEAKVIQEYYLDRWNGGEWIAHHCLQKLDSVYIHTPEELALAFREVAEKAAMVLFDENLFSPEYVKHAIEKYLDQHYPLPQPINTNQ